MIELQKSGKVNLSLPDERRWKDYGAERKNLGPPNNQHGVVQMTRDEECCIIMTLTDLKMVYSNSFGRICL
jgi:hypothetical protein